MPWLETTVTSLAAGGDGVAHAELAGERRAIFVPSTVPGDRVRIEVDIHRRPARGRLLELLSPGEARTTPACAWAGLCGGCDWMHISLAAQATAHAEQLRAALPSHWRQVDIPTMSPAGALGYRSRARLHILAKRGGRVVVGMHQAGTHDPVEPDACVVLDPALEEGRLALGPIFAGCHGRGEAKLALGTNRHPVVDVAWCGVIAPETFARLEQAVARGALAGAQIMLEDATRPAKVGDPTPWMSGADGLPLRLAAGGFSQACERANAALVAHVAEQVRPLRAERAVELYSGAGNLSVLVAPAVGELACVESSRELCDAARFNLSSRGLRARVVEADAATYEWGPATKLVVLDPPRTGARAVAERLAASKVPWVVYVSCDPQTLGRDLAIVQPTYELTSITAFEMFPQTSHVETVVALQRRRT